MSSSLNDTTAIASGTIETPDAETTVVTFGLASVKARAELIFTDLSDTTKRLDLRGQALVPLIAEAYAVYTSNPSVKVAAIADMIDSHHKRTPSFSHFLGMLKTDIIGARPTAVTIESAGDDSVNDMARYNARVTQLSNACKAFVAIMVNSQADTDTGKVRLWDDAADCLVCPSASFKPVHVAGMEAAFKWCDDDVAEYVTLNGGVWACQRKAINKKTGKEYRQVESGNFSMSRLLTAFYRTPDADKAGSETKSEAGVVKDGEGNPDQARNDTPDFWGHMKAAHAIMFTSDTKLPSLEDVDGIPNGMDVLRDLSRLYISLAAAATERAQSLARTTPSAPVVVPIVPHATATPTPAEPIIDATPDAAPTPDTKPTRKQRNTRKLAA